MAVEPATAPRTDQRLLRIETAGGQSPYRIEKLKGEFAEGELARRYNIILKLDGPNVPSQAILPVWCTDEMDVQEYIASEKKDNSFLLMCGLLASPDQYDWPELSAIKNFSHALEMVKARKEYPEVKPFKPVFIGMAGPGFDGSEILPGDPRSKIDPMRVSVETYNEMVDQAEQKLKLGPEVSYIGHSAGGAVALLHKSKAQGHMNARKFIALHPAIQVDKATQFLFVKFLLNFIPILQNVDKVFKGNVAEVLAKDVVRILNGYVPTTKTLADTLRFLTETDFNALPMPVQRQVMLHVNEIFAHLNAAIAKAVDLQRVHERGGVTRAESLIITGEDDIITFVEDVTGEYGRVKVFEGVHHDDFFTDPKVQEKYIGLMVNYIVHSQTPKLDMEPRLSPTKLRRMLKFLGRALGKVDRGAKRSSIFNRPVN